MLRSDGEEFWKQNLQKLKMLYNFCYNLCINIFVTEISWVVWFPKKVSNCPSHTQATPQTDRWLPNSWFCSVWPYLADDGCILKTCNIILNNVANNVNNAFLKGLPWHKYKTQVQRRSLVYSTFIYIYWKILTNLFHCDFVLFHKYLVYSK